MDIVSMSHGMVGERHHHTEATSRPGLVYVTDTQFQLPRPGKYRLCWGLAMQQASTSFIPARSVGLLMAAGLLFVPFDGVRGVSALGELGNELSFPFFAGAIAIGLVMGLRTGEARLQNSLALRIGAACLAVIALSYAVNAGAINSGEVRGRAALPKFTTSLLVIVYGIGLAWLAEQVPPGEFRKRVARYIGWSAAIAIGYALFELAGRSILRGPFTLVDALVHSRQSDIINSWDGRINQKVLFNWDERIRSVSFEPPAFGNFTGFAWPWLWFGAVAAPAGRKLWSWALLTAFTATILLSQSRTGLLMFAVNLLGLGALAFLYARPRASSEAAAAMRLVLPSAMLLAGIVVALRTLDQSQALVDRVVLGDSVSNLSRLAFQSAGLSIFLAHPLVGVGLGQFGFHVADALPAWAFLSPEVRPMVTFAEAPWPNVYNLYVRLAAELGLIGLLGWCLLWSNLFFRLGRQARAADQLDFTLRFAAYPVALNCLGVLASGITTDTLRTPMLWISLGLACSLVRQDKRVPAPSISQAATA